MGRTIKKWSAVCSEAPHLRFGEEVRPYFVHGRWNRPTPVRRRLSLTHAVWGKLISIGLVLVLGMKPRSLDVFSVLRVEFIIRLLRSADTKSGKDFSILYLRNRNLHIFNLSKIQIFFSIQKILIQLFTVQSYLFFISFANQSYLFFGTFANVVYETDWFVYHLKKSLKNKLYQDN